MTSNDFIWRKSVNSRAIRERLDKCIPYLFLLPKIFSHEKTTMMLLQGDCIYLQYTSEISQGVRRTWLQIMRNSCWINCLCKVPIQSHIIIHSVHLDTWCCPLSRNYCQLIFDVPLFSTQLKPSGHYKELDTALYTDIESFVIPLKNLEF